MDSDKSTCKQCLINIKGDIKMKLRQKLAVVLASAMVVTAVPVVTMAETSNKVVSSVRVIEKDDKTTGVALRMKFEDGMPDEEEEFYFTLTNAEWLDGSDDEDKAIIEGLGNIVVDADDEDVWELTPGSYSTDKTSATVTYTRQSDKVLRVNVKGLEAADIVNFTLPIKATGGDVSVAVTGEGSSSTVSEGSYKLLATGEDAASLTVASEPNAFYQDGELSAITLKETFKGSFAADDMVLKISLQDTDFEFDEASNVKIEGSYGFNFKYMSAEDDKEKEFKYDSSKVKFTVDAEDASVAYIWLSKDLAKDAKSQGRIEITGIEVSSDEKDLTEGNLLADIETVDSVAKADTTAGITLPGGADLDKDYDDVVVAKIANYGVAITMKDDKAVDIVAGRDEEVVFTVKESVDDVFVGGRSITLSLKDSEGKTDEQYFMISAAQKADPLSIIDDNANDMVKKVEFTFEDEEDYNGKDTSNIYYKKGMYRVNEIKVTFADTDEDKDALNKNDDVDKFKVKTKIYVPVDQQDKKSVEIVGELRGEDVKGTTAVNIVDPFDVTFKQTTLKVGLQDQEMGNITLTEKDKEMLMKGDLVFDIVNGSKKEDGIVIEDEGTLTVTGDLKKTDDFEISGSTADKVTLKRQSKAASTLAIDKMLVTVDRTVPEGYYDLELSGEAVDEYDGTYTVDDYIVIGTPNTQDITSAGLTKGTVTFVIGESKYSVNGEEVAMDAPSYIQDPGYTMVPVRYVAQAFGVASKDILFGNGSVTIFAGERTLNLTNGSKVATVNGNPVQMGAAVVIKDGRTYVPAGEIARLIGISTSWDASTKTDRKSVV